MLNSKIVAVATKATLSAAGIASTTYVSYCGDLKRRQIPTTSDPDSSVAAQSPAGTNTAANVDLDDDFADKIFFNHDDDQRFLVTNNTFINEARKEIRTASKELSDSSAFLRNTKIRVIVLERFLDLMARSILALADFKLHAVRNGDEVYLSHVHARTAQSMHNACAQHGGILVKLGQYVAANAGGFVPKVYIETLSQLQDSCSPMSAKQIEELIDAELRVCYGYEAGLDGEPLWKQVFSEIESVPLGSASLAQVHAATLHDGRRVAVKVQRPNLDVITQADIMALSVLSKAIEFAFPGTGFDWILPEFYKTVTAELDFTQEATNAERCERMLRGSSLITDTSLVNFLAARARALFSLKPVNPPTVIIPKPFRELTTTKLMTMTYEEGFRITAHEKLDAYGIDPKKVAAASCALFSELMMVHGFCYADCHPGNVLIRPRGRASPGEFDIVLLDHGMYRRLEERFRAGYCNLWAGLVSGNDDQALKGIRILGLPDNYLDVMGLVLTYRIPAGILNSNSLTGRNKLGTVAGKETRERVRSYLREHFGEDAVSPAGMNRFIASQSPDLLFCMRCTNLVRGMNRELGGTTLDRFVAFGAAASRGANLTLVEMFTPITKTEADVLTSPWNDVLAEVKASLNKPVASEIHAQGRARQNSILVPAGLRTFSNFFETYKLSLRTWVRGLLFDFILLIRGADVDRHPRNLG